MTRRPASLLVVIALLLAPCVVVQAQTGDAAINGQVRDTSGAVVPKVQIQVTNIHTNAVLKTETNSEGIYSIRGLAPGTYRFVAKLASFKTFEQEGIVLRVGDRVSIDPVLQVGTQTETVTVVGETPLLRTEDTTMGAVLDTRSIERLPQYNRNALALAHMAPNVNGTSEQGGYDGDFRINGGRTAQVEYLVDGTATTTGYKHDTPVAMPSMEAVGEFRVLTNGFSAEYGRLSGGLVTLVTRGGTNQLHGALYEFFRNDHLNANSFDNNRRRAAKSAFHDNVFGFRVGGPVVIPKLYQGRDRTFFFVNFEGSRSVTANRATIGSTLSELERQGDFSQSRSGGRQVTIYDPLTGARGASSVVTRQPFAGNRIPSSRIDPIAKKYIEYYPLPNRAPLANSSHDQNFLGFQTSKRSGNRWTGRLDRNWNSSHITQFSLTAGDSWSAATPWFSALQRYSATDNYSWTAAFNHTWSYSPSLVFNFRAGVVRNLSGEDTRVDVDTSSWGWSREALLIMGTGVNRAPYMDNKDTLTLLGGGQSSSYYDTIYNLSVSLQKLWQRHIIKAGFEHRRYYSNVPSGGNLSYSSDTSGTSQTSPANSTGSGVATMMLGLLTGGGGTGYGGAAALQPYYAAYLQDDIKLTKKLTVNLGVRWDLELPVYERFNRVAMWDPDYVWDVKPSSSWNWAAVERAVGMTLKQPAWLTSGKIRGRLLAGGTPEHPDRTVMDLQKYQFSPRAGFAWQFLPKSVLRAGYGINYLTNTGSMMLNYATWNFGYAASGSIYSTGSMDGGLTYITTLGNPFPNGLGYVPFSRMTTTQLNQAVVGGGLSPQIKNWDPGYEHVVNMSIQRELFSGKHAWLLELGYSGNFGRNLSVYGWGWNIMPNAYYELGPYGDKLKTQVPNPFYGVLPAQGRNASATVTLGSLYAVSPIWGDIWSIGDPLGVSNYNAGYLQVERRFAHGFSFNGAYTFSKLLNDTGSVDQQQMQGRNTDAIPQAGLGMGDIYGAAKTDITHKWVSTFSYDMPVGRGKRFLGRPQSIGAKVLDYAVGGWQIAGMSVIRSGTPVQIQLRRASPTNAVGNWWAVGQGKASRAVWVAGQPFVMPGASNPRLAIEGTAGFQYFFNPRSVREPVGLEIGDVPTTCSYLRNPGAISFDLALMKDFRIAERVKLQLRAEAQNAFNHLNVGAPGNTQNNANFGYITANGAPRYIMVAGKILF